MNLTFLFFIFLRMKILILQYEFFFLKYIAIRFHKFSRNSSD
jgi:hypothetical protein